MNDHAAHVVNLLTSVIEFQAITIAFLVAVIVRPTIGKRLRELPRLWRKA